jgi:hypothetical protein
MYVFGSSLQDLQLILLDVIGGGDQVGVVNIVVIVLQFLAEDTFHIRTSPSQS